MKTPLIVSAAAVLAAALVPSSGLATPGDLYVSSSTDILKYGQDGNRRVFASGLRPAYSHYDCGSFLHWRGCDLQRP